MIFSKKSIILSTNESDLTSTDVDAVEDIAESNVVLNGLPEIPELLVLGLLG
jgi:hypothetical protein